MTSDEIKHEHNKNDEIMDIIYQMSYQQKIVFPKYVLLVYCIVNVIITLPPIYRNFNSDSNIRMRLLSIILLVLIFLQLEKYTGKKHFKPRYEPYKYDYPIYAFLRTINVFYN